jgi:2-polyprenyl-6-methoxyphenol hydroxylase-like FAD-dependent oxidoreductase
MPLTHIEKTSESVRVTFAVGMADTCDLLVGADEIYSAFRTIHVGPSHQTEYAGLSSLCSLILTDNLTFPRYFGGSFRVINFRRRKFARGFMIKPVRLCIGSTVMKYQPEIEKVG